MAHKGPGDAPTYDASQTSTLRIGILHTRWNTPIVSSLLTGTLRSLHTAGIPPANIIVQSVPGSYELPYAAQRMYTAGATHSASASSNLAGAAADLLGGSISDLASPVAPAPSGSAGEDAEVGAGEASPGPLDAIVAIGVLVKGSTMHFEYISDAVSHGLMRVQLDTGCPVIFGVLTCLTEEQAHTRAGMKGEVMEGVSHGESGHNHGEDWGWAAVEMAVKRRGWGEGRFL